MSSFLTYHNIKPSDRTLSPRDYRPQQQPPPKVHAMCAQLAQVEPLHFSDPYSLDHL
jgi:hypothetical protein